MQDFAAGDSIDKRERAASALALDRAYLARQTLGDRALELELLTLFDRQASKIAAILSEARRPGDASPRADLAHKLKGAARAVGALALGDVADAYEEALRRGDPGADARGAALLDAIAAARAAIGALIEPGDATSGAGG